MVSPPLGGAKCRGHAQALLLPPTSLFLLPAPQEAAVVSVSSSRCCCSLHSAVSASAALQIAAHQAPLSRGISQPSPRGEYTLVLLVPYRFYFCCWRRHSSKYKHYSKGPGPRAQLVSVPQGLPTAFQGQWLPPKAVSAKRQCLDFGGSRGPPGLDRAALQTLEIPLPPRPRGSRAMAGSLLESGTNRNVSGRWEQGEERTLPENQ